MPPDFNQFLGYWSEQAAPVDYAASAYAWNVIYRPFKEMVRALLNDARRKLVVPMSDLNDADYKFVARPADLGNFVAQGNPEAR